MPFIENSGGGGGGGSGTVTQVSSANAAIAVATGTTTPVLTAGTLDVIAAQGPPAASVAMNAKKITGLAAATAATDAASLANTLDLFGAPAANVAFNAKKITGLANGTAATDAAAFGQILPEYTFKSGEYYNASRNLNIASTFGSLTQNRIYFVPLFIPVSTSFQSISMSVQTAQASNTFRLGIWQDNGLGAPGALIVDAGTVDGSTTGGKTATISQTFSGVVWLGIVEQGGAAGAQPYGAAINEVHASISAGQFSQWVSTSTAISGALPNPAGAVTVTNPGTLAPWLLIQAT